MLKKSKIKILIFLISIIIISCYWFISSTFENNKFKNLKSLLTKDQKQLIKKFIFPYKFISEQGQYITQQDKLLVEFDLPNYELLKKQEGSEIILRGSIEKL